TTRSRSTAGLVCWATACPLTSATTRTMGWESAARTAASSCTSSVCSTVPGRGHRRRTASGAGAEDWPRAGGLAAMQRTPRHSARRALHGLPPKRPKIAMKTSSVRRWTARSSDLWKRGQTLLFQITCDAHIKLAEHQAGEALELALAEL